MNLVRHTHSLGEGVPEALVAMMAGKWADSGDQGEDGMNEGTEQGVR